MPFLFVGSCCALLSYSRALPNGHWVSYMNNSSALIINRKNRVMVDDHIVSWETDGHLVHGEMANGVTFTFDTETSIALYSNGIKITDGKHVKVRDLPNEYSLWSCGNSQYVKGPNGYSITSRDILNVQVVHGSVITGNDDRGREFEINTETKFYKFQMHAEDDAQWATYDEDHRTVVIETDTAE